MGILFLNIWQNKKWRIMESEINIKLKSCPFCGGHATMIYDNQEGYYIYCDDCCIMTGNSFDKEKIINTWNNRVVINERE